MNKKTNAFYALLFITVFLTGGVLLAQSAALKKRMEARRPAVDALLAKGAAGENNQGFLAPRGALHPDEEKILREENRDRREVYQAIARKTGESAAAVGRHRAAQIAKRAKPGVWLQDARGKWYQKK